VVAVTKLKITHHSTFNVKQIE